jgi:hypothetical protein
MSRYFNLSEVISKKSNLDKISLPMYTDIRQSFPEGTGTGGFGLIKKPTRDEDELLNRLQNESFVPASERLFSNYRQKKRG